MCFSLSFFMFYICPCVSLCLSLSHRNTFTNKYIHSVFFFLCLKIFIEFSLFQFPPLKCREELTANQELTCAAIDALTYLNISQEQVVQVTALLLLYILPFTNLYILSFHKKLSTSQLSFCCLLIFSLICHIFSQLNLMALAR